MSPVTRGPSAPVGRGLHDPRLEADLRALQARLSPAWWFGLTESVLLGAVLGLMAVNAGIAGLTAGMVCLVVLILGASFYPRAQGAAIDRTFHNSTMAGWQVLAFLALGVVVFVASFLMDRAATSWPGRAGLVLVVMIAVYLSLQLTTRDAARRITANAGYRALTQNRHPQVDPLLRHDDDALRMATLLFFVDRMRPNALREDLQMTDDEFDETLDHLRRNGYVSPLQRDPSGDDPQAWLRLSLSGQTALSDHLAALQKDPTAASA